MWIPALPVQADSVGLLPLRKENLPARQKTPVGFLGQEDPLGKG